MSCATATSAGRRGSASATLTDEEWLEHFGRFEPLPGSFAEPLALRYHGHQFQVYNPQLGDGRGFLFAQLHDLVDGRLLDLGTKGSGRTPWSRGGDGRLTLKGGVRELLASEMLEALGVDTSKTFSLIETGEELQRSDEPSPTRSSVLVRLSHSHIRIGTFQRFAYHEDTRRPAAAARLRRADLHARGLARRRGRPARWPSSSGSRPTSRAPGRSGWPPASSTACSTPTTSTSPARASTTGPWRFLPTYDPGFTAAYFDESGLYAFGRQPATLLWNLTRLAECLLPLAPQAELEAALDGFRPAFQRELRRRCCAGWACARRRAEADGALVEALFEFLEATRRRSSRPSSTGAAGSPARSGPQRSPSAELYAAAGVRAAAGGPGRLEPADGRGARPPLFRRRDARAPC